MGQHSSSVLGHTAVISYINAQYLYSIPNIKINSHGSKKISAAPPTKPASLHSIALLSNWCVVSGTNYLHQAEAFLKSHQLCSYLRISQHYMEPEGPLSCPRVPPIVSSTVLVYGTVKMMTTKDDTGMKHKEPQYSYTNCRLYFSTVLSKSLTTTVFFF
jgi:hypothetical protein